MRDAAVHRAHEVGEEHHRALEDADEVQIFVGHVAADLVRAQLRDDALAE